MKIKLVFHDWKQTGKAGSIYASEIGVGLSKGDLHSGSTFEAEIVGLPEDVEQDIRYAWTGWRAYPVFALLPQEERQP